MSPLRVLRGFTFGALGGVLAWMLIEFLPFGYPFQPSRFEGPDMTPPSAEPQVQALLGLVLGLAIGGMLGVSEGIAEGTTARFKRAFFTFLLLGPLGGFIGLYFGTILFDLLGGKVRVSDIAPHEFFPQLLARSAGWMLIGLFLGMVFGVPTFSTRRMWNGAVGGAIGGFLGGFVFQVLMFTGQFRGMQVRLLGFVMIGAAVGFFINLIAEAAKRVWVKVLVGRNEGREHVIDTAVASIGRDELADVPVFLDPAVPRRIASLRLAGGRYALHPESDLLPIQVNGQPAVPGQVLRDGDAIQFGRVTLGYYEKATASGFTRPVDTIPLADFGTASVVPGATPLPTSPYVCEFCGQPRDAATGACACSVPAADPAYAPGGYAPAGYDPGGHAPGAAYGYGGAPAADPYAPAAPEPGYGYPAAESGSGPRLTAIDGPYAGQVFPLAGAEAAVGRDASQTIALTADGTASRRHARFVAAGGGWTVRDEGSANGTWVNGVRIQEQALFPGDVIRIGASHFRFDA